MFFVDYCGHTMLHHTNIYDSQSYICYFFHMDSFFFFLFFFFFFWSLTLTQGLFLEQPFTLNLPGELLFSLFCLCCGVAVFSSWLPAQALNQRPISSVLKGWKFDKHNKTCVCATTEMIAFLLSCCLKCEASCICFTRFMY